MKCPLRGQTLRILSIGSSNKYLAFASLTLFLLVSAISDASAVKCAKGVKAAGCAGSKGAVGVSSKGAVGVKRTGHGANVRGVRY